MYIKQQKTSNQKLPTRLKLNFIRDKNLIFLSELCGNNNYNIVEIIKLYYLKTTIFDLENCIAP